MWLKQYEPALKKEVPKLTVLNEGNKEVCPGCPKKVKYWTEGVECEACLNWYHLGYGNISESDYAYIAETVWYFIACKKQQEADRAENGVKIFLRYIDDILDFSGNLAFLDLNVNVDSGKKVTCGWYQKPTDTGTILNFIDCARIFEVKRKRH